MRQKLHLSPFIDDKAAYFFVFFSRCKIRAIIFICSVARRNIAGRIAFYLQLFWLSSFGFTVKYVIRIRVKYGAVTLFLLPFVQTIPKLFYAK